MQPIYHRLAVAMIVGIAVGTIGGQATVGSLIQPAIRPARIAPEPLGSAPYTPDNFADANPERARYARIAAACDNCSDYDLGYRFAASSQLRATADCMDYSWSYQRGCLAYLRKG